MFGRRVKALWITLITVAIPAQALPQALPRPPMRPGEVILVTANGCGIVLATSKLTVESIRKNRALTATDTWKGGCLNGLAHGKGRMNYPARDTYEAGSYAVEYFYGRSVPIMQWDHGETWYYTQDGRSVASTTGANLDVPIWTPGRAEFMSSTGVMVLADKQSIQTETSCGWDSCDYSIRQSWIGEDRPSVTTPCPQPKTTAGCDALWRQLAGPLIATYRSVRAEVEGGLPGWRNELTQLNAARDARLAALDVASGEAFARGQAAALAEVGQADKTFKAKLAAANAGQLYVMADEYERGGDSDKAGQALRALLTRFPDHGLAVTAAQRLSALPPPRVSGAGCAAAEEEARLAANLRSAMNRIPGGNPTWRYEAVMAASQQSAAAWARCPTHPTSEAKVRNYRAAYVEAARKCAMISPGGACTAQMH